MRNLLILLLLTALTGCKKDPQPPDLQLKTGAGYTSTDITAPPGAQLVIGVNAYKTSDNLNLFYTEVAYDGANAPALVSRTWMNDDEKEHFSRDITITLRNQVGTERWILNINDAEGRITKKELRISVQ